MSRRYTLNNSSQPSGSTGTSTGSTAPTSPAPANSGGKTPNSQKSVSPGILLGISGGWLVARMFLLGGSLWILEIIAVIIAAGIAHSKGGKGQKVTSKIIIILAVLNFFIPGFNSWVKGIRDNQLNPSPPEQSTQQEQVAPAPVEETISTERVVVSGRKITLTGDGTYTVPTGRKSLCFTAMGKTDGSEISDQTVEIEYKGEKLRYSSLGSKCLIFPDNIVGKIKVDFFPGKSWGEEPVLSNMYKRYRTMPGGQGDWPVIRIGE